MTEELDTDVCVIGGGPAGLALTLMLLRSGIRVALVERAAGLRRAFHGALLQPGGQRVLDELGVLAAAASRGAASLRGVQVVDRERVLLDIDYGRLPAPYDHLLALPQPHVLRELLDACRTLPGFTLLEGHRIAALLERRPGSPCQGAVVHGPDRVPLTVRAAVVVGADGRFSKTRSLAGIDAGRCACLNHDVVSFSLCAPRRATGRVRVHRGPGGAAVLVHDSHPDRVEVAWALPPGRVRAGGPVLPEVRRELAGILPHLADLLHAQLTSPADLAVLSVSAAHARQWVRDGLVLLGDSAHTHGPLGAQGIGLALQDAAALHPVLVDAVHAQDAGAGRLAVYEERRGAAAAAVHRRQVAQARTMFGGGPSAAALLRARAAGLVARTPIGVKTTRAAAHGHDPAAVRTDLFTVLPAHRGWGARPL